MALMDEETLGQFKSEVESYYQRYDEFVESYDFSLPFVQWIFASAYNYLWSGKLLAEKGLRPQSHNCLRMGLEFQWLGLNLECDKYAAFVWSTGGDQSEKDTKLLKDLENTSRLMKKLQDGKKVKVQHRRNFYNALSDTSHAKLRNIQIMTLNGNTKGYPKGGLESNFDIHKCMQSPHVVIRFALAEIEERLKCDLGMSDWEYLDYDMLKICNEGTGDESGDVTPHITSKWNPGSDASHVLSILSMIQNKGFK